MRQVVSICTLMLLAASIAAAQGRNLKVFISADMEGIGGVASDVQTAPGGREYEKFRRLMTQEVNASIVGAFEGGATEVLVNDSHADGQNIDIEMLDPRARLLRAFPRPLGMMEGIDATYGAVVFVGYHTSEGQANAVLPHTFHGRMAVKLNDIVVPEAGFNAAVAGDFGVPVVFLSGDQSAGDEAKRLLGPIETVAVKQAIGFHSAVMVHPEESQRLIHAGVKRALKRRDDIKPYRVARPVKLEILFQDIVNAELVSYLPGIERPRGDTIVFTAHDMIEASKFLQAAMHLRP
jgi:D-amino peptidase